MTSPATPSAPEFPIVNGQNATFECVFGRGFEGACCKNGRPPVYPREAENIQANLPKFIDRLRPEVRALVLRFGFLSRRKALGQPMMRVANKWCVFFNRGCVLHAAGAEEGDKYRYKPLACALFPLAKDRRGRWKVRQRGFDGEIWDLACLDPEASKVRAQQSLQDEIELARALSREEPVVGASSDTMREASRANAD